MAEMFWNKFRQLRGVIASSLVKARQSIKTKRVTLVHRGMVRKNQLQKSWAALHQKVWYRLLGLFFDIHHGVRLVNSRTAVLGYFIFFVLCLGGVIVLDGLDSPVNLLHPEGANEAIIGATTILLALFIPLAIALIEDARVSPLARLTVVKRVVRFRATLFALLFICIFLFVPQGWQPLGEGPTIRELYAAVLAPAMLFILMGFLRAYRWLSDPSINSSGDPETLSPDDPQPEAFPSYRFAHIVKLLSNAKGYDTWCIVWSQHFPPEYENVLHAAFFNRQRAAIRSKKIKRYIILSVEVEAYDKYFSKRNKDTWWFYLDYIKQFLLLYADVTKLIDSDRTTARTAGLWRGKAALERISKRLISNSLSPDRVWHLFEAMDEYLLASDLLDVKKKSHPHDSLLLDYFIDEYFESQFSGELDRYYVESYLKEHPYWLVTHDNLYEHRYNVSFVVVDRFKDWLFKKLDAAKDKEGSMYQLDSIIKELFPEVDPITISDLYWLLYQAQNTTDSEFIVKNHYTSMRPFGVFGRVSVADWVDDPELRMKNFAKVQHEQEENAIKLFATMYSTYFLRFWHLDELIKVAEATHKKGGLEEKERQRLESLIKRLKAVRAFFQNQRKKLPQADKRKQK